MLAGQFVGNSKRINIGEAAERIFRGIPPPRQSTIGIKPVHFINIKDIVAGRVDLGNIDMVEISPGDQNRYQLYAGDVLLSSRGTVLKSAVVPEGLTGAIPSANFTVIRLKPDLAPELLAAFFQSPEGQRRLLAGVQSSTQQKALTVAEISAITIPIPPLEYQQKLASMVAAADRYYGAAVEAAAARREIAYTIVAQAMTRTLSMPLEVDHE